MTNDTLKFAENPLLLKHFVQFLRREGPFQYKIGFKNTFEEESFKK